MNNTQRTGASPLAWMKRFVSHAMKSRYFLRNLIFFSTIMLLFFLILSIATYRRSSKILQSEFTSSSNDQIAITANSVDSYLKDMRYLMATLDQNSLVQAFFNYQSPEDLYDKYETRLQELLASYVYTDSTIDSIYLYSGLSENVATWNKITSLNNLEDNQWLETFRAAPERDRILIFPRAKNGYYPFLLTFIKPILSNGKESAIVLNLNLSKIPYLQDVQSNPYRDVYLVTSNNEVLYSHNQQKLLLPADTFPRLSTLKHTSDVYSTIVSDDEGTYIFTQLRSSNYPWYYVTITNLSAYTNQLSRNNTFLFLLFSLVLLAIIIMIFLFSFRTTQPIYKILSILDSSNGLPQQEFQTHDEVQLITEQIIKYAQHNEELSDELTKRLNLLNETKMMALQSQINPHFIFNTLNMIYSYECEELGFHHKLPNLTLKLSRLMHYAFESSALVSMDTELTFLKMYLELMQQRYNNRFDIEYEVDPTVLNIQVPKLIIQPIAENAIFHGLSTNRKPGSCLRIVCRAENGMCVVSILDNGVGMEAETLEMLRNIANTENPHHTSVGLRNVITRMRLLYGNQFSLEINSVINEGSAFIMRFPPLPISGRETGD